MGLRKAKREGKTPEHYLNVGVVAPAAAWVAETKKILKAVGQTGPAKDTRFDTWRANHGQHCWAHHVDVGGCSRGRVCAFLHSEALGSDDINGAPTSGGADNAPSWLTEMTMTD